MEQPSIRTLDEVRRKAALLSTPVLALLSLTGAWVIQALPLQWWETPFFIAAAMSFLFAGFVAWKYPQHSTYTTALIIVTIVVLLEGRILSVFQGPVLADGSNSMFLVLFAHFPLLYLFCFMVFPSQLALKWSIAACVLLCGTTLAFVIPMLLEDPMREGGRHLLMWLLLSNPGFVTLMSALRRIERALIQLHSQHDAVAARQALYQHQATHDYLTGLLNRLSFDNYLEDAWSQARSHKLPLCLLMLDVDHFKSVNDDYGHPAGDKALQALAVILSSKIRTQDVVTRYGGEEFGVLLRNTNYTAAADLGERLRKAVETTPLLVDGMPIHTTISVGIACLRPEENTRPDTLINQADIALYAAKRNGRNCVELFEKVPQPEPKLAKIMQLNKA
ncbi:MAG: GGDEF domain-containing protein [Gammaproteobacteria bacterium]|nr:GGDEF domain-containing protein [Gammaproteobacteria bacterium]